MSRILLVVAHPDDEILGVGGTMYKRILNGDMVSCLILGEGMTSRKTERAATSQDSIELLHSHSKRVADLIGFSELEFGNLPDNRFDSVDLLDVIKKVEKQIESFKPDIVYTHHYGDLNIDHQITFQAVLTACRPIDPYCVKELYCFETPSATEWNLGRTDVIFRPNVWIEINEESLKCKLKAMEIYESELREFPHPRSLEALEIIAKRWGIVVGKKYAEAFELVRKVD